MKKQLLLTIMCGLVGLSLNAQTYCNITTATAYSLNMPGITNFTLNTIDRTSLAIECGSVTCNSYVNTGDSTELEQGKTYNVSLTHTRDSVIFDTARNNIRVWIDYNNNGKLDDAGETVVSIDLESFGTTTATFTVPTTATLGSTGMRITLKMSDDAGHILPTPCDIPADPLGYHGEFEDYVVTIKASTTGIKPNQTSIAVSLFPNPSNGSFMIQSKTKISTIEVIDLLGAKVYSAHIDAYKADVDLTKQPKGIYLYTLTDGDKIITRGKIILD